MNRRQRSGLRTRLRQVVLALVLSSSVYLGAPALASAASSQMIWVPAKTVTHTSSLGCKDHAVQTPCQVVSTFHADGHYTPRYNALTQFGAASADYCPGGFGATGAAKWYNSLYYENIFGGVLVAAQTYGQTAWNGSTACTVFAQNTSYSGYGWSIHWVQGPGSYWDYTQNANDTWETVCGYPPIAYYSDWRAFLNQYTNQWGSLRGGNWSDGNC
jgi:hypothetical protein